MFSAALRSGAAPLRAIPRKSVAIPAFRNAVAGRKVTTDAASAHADKESVPEVGRWQSFPLTILELQALQERILTLIA